MGCVRRQRAATVYELRSSVSSVACLFDGTPKEASFTVELYRIVGVGVPQLYKAKLSYIRCNGDVCTTPVLFNAVSSIPVVTGKYAYYVILAYDETGQTLLTQKRIDSVCDGNEGIPGPSGKRGMLPYPCGIWDKDVTYVATGTITPYVYYELGKEYYVLEKVGSCVGIDPAEDVAANGSDATWARFDEYKAVFAEILMANFAKLASAVFWGDCMFSQHGVDAYGNKVETLNGYKGFSDGTFRPNLLLNFLTGDVDLAGKIKAKSGSQIAGMTVEGNSLRGIQAIFGKYNYTVTNNDKDKYTIINNIGSQLTYFFEVPDNDKNMDCPMLLPSAHDLLLKGIDEFSFELSIVTHRMNKWTLVLKGNDDAGIYLNGVKSSVWAMAKGEVMKLIYHSNGYYIVSNTKL